jgi:RimJ/RimL family protein N-acetyltransferase
MAHNERAIRLYERMGFEREGIRRRALRVDGEWVDELFMALLLTSGGLASDEEAREPE